MPYKDPKQAAIAKKKYQDAHIEQHRKSCREYNARNKNKVRVSSKKWYYDNIEKMKEYHKAYRTEYNKTHIEERQQYWHDYYLKNRKRLHEVKRKWQLNARISNINFRISGNLRTRLNLAIKNNSKAGHTYNLIGCSIDFLKRWLELQFKPGMSWSNYGKWHIDHIKPCASFELSKAKEQYRCFHYTNLQPLWAKENFKKSDNLIREEK